MIEIVQDILKLPPLAYAIRNFPKSFFDRNFKLTATEKRYVNTPYLPLKATWLAELNTKTINVPVLENKEFSYTRIPVFIIQLSAEHWETDLEKLCTLYHKHIPFPVLIFAHNSEQYILSTATKSINKNDKTKRVVEQQYTTPKISLLLKDEVEVKFRESLQFQSLNRINLKTVYESYISSIVNYRRAQKVGTFEVRKETETLNENLNEIQTIEKEARILKNKLLKTKDIREKVELQMQLSKLRDLKSQLENEL
jgi:hypothetical protein